MADPVGIEARGRAGVFGTGMNPMQTYFQIQAGRQKRADLLQQQEREQRDKLIDNYEKWSPDKVREPFYDQINRAAQANVRDRFDMLRASGMPISRIRSELQRAYGEVNTLVHEANGKMDEYDAAVKTLDSDDVGKYYKRTQAKSRVRDIYFNGRQARDIREIDETKIQNVFDDVDNFDLNAISVDFMKSLPEKVNQKYIKIHEQTGDTYDIQETKTKIGWQEATDQFGRKAVVLDPRTGLPKISMTDEVFIQAMENDYLRKVVDRYVPNGTMTQQRDFLTKLLEGLDPASIQSRPQLGRALPDADQRYSAYGFGFSHPIADLRSRHDRYVKITDGNRKDLLRGLDDPNSDLRAFYGDAEGNVIDPATTKPKSIVLAHVAVPKADGTGFDMEKFARYDMITRWDVRDVLKAQASGRVIKNEVILIGDEDQKREARIAMSRRDDKLDTRRAIGEDYSNYEEALYQNQLSKAPPKKIAIPGFPGSLPK